jgi:hypothetical protein
VDLLPCIQVSTSKGTTSTCLHLVFNTRDSSTNNTRTLKEISAYIIFGKDWVWKRIWKVMGWKKYADIIEKSSSTKKSNCLPTTSTACEQNNPNPDKSLMICSNVIPAVVDKGNKFWNTCSKATISNIVPMHGFKGKISNLLHPDWMSFWPHLVLCRHTGATRTKGNYNGAFVDKEPNQGQQSDLGSSGLDDKTRLEQEWKMRARDIGNWKRTPRQDKASRSFWLFL